MYVNEPIDYEYTHSFLVLIICHDIFVKCKAKTSAYNVQNVFCMQPSDKI